MIRDGPEQIDCLVLLVFILIEGAEWIDDKNDVLAGFDSEQGLLYQHFLKLFGLILDVLRPFGLQYDSGDSKDLNNGFLPVNARQNLLQVHHDKLRGFKRL